MTAGHVLSSTADTNKGIRYEVMGSIQASPWCISHLFLSKYGHYLVIIHGNKYLAVYQIQRFGSKATNNETMKLCGTKTLPEDILLITDVNQTESSMDPIPIPTHDDDDMNEGEKSSLQNDRLLLVLQGEKNLIQLFDALTLTNLTDFIIPLKAKHHQHQQEHHSSSSQQIQGTLIWEYEEEILDDQQETVLRIDRILIGMCATNLQEWFVFNEADGLKSAFLEANQYSTTTTAASFLSPFQAPIHLNNTSYLDNSINSIPSSSLNLLHPTTTPINTIQEEHRVHTDILRMVAYAPSESPIVIAWSLKECMLLRVQSQEGHQNHRLTVTRQKSYQLAEIDPCTRRMKIVTAKSLKKTSSIRNHRAIIVLSNGFAIVTNF
jgi:hypothetical protein